MKLKNIIFVFFLVLFLSILFTPYMGYIYLKIIQKNISIGFWGPSNPEYFEGFALSFVLFSSLILQIRKVSRRYYYYFILPFILLSIIAKEFFVFIISLICVGVGIVLAKLILFIKDKIKK